MYKLTIKRSRVADPPAPYGSKVTGPADVARLATALTAEEDQEVFLVFVLDVKNKVIAYQEVARGGLDSCPVDPRVIFRAALVTPGIVGLILCHNHPSGDTTPSSADHLLTARIQAGADILGVHLVDHVIVADQAAPFSFQENRLLGKGRSDAL